MEKPLFFVGINIVKLELGVTQNAISKRNKETKRETSDNKLSLYMPETGKSPTYQYRRSQDRKYRRLPKSRSKAGRDF